MTKSMRNRVLIIFAHPALSKSRINIELLNEVRGIEGVTVRDLYEEYPDFLIDVKKEQELLLENDLIIFQHPFYWYSSPAIIKEWEDLVLEFGFAYGPGGIALNGKMMMNAITAGGSFDSYSDKGIHFYKVRDFLKPFEQSSILCGMQYLPPFVVHGASGSKDSKEIALYRGLYGKIICALRDGDMDVEELQGFQYINDYYLEKNEGRGL